MKGIHLKAWTRCKVFAVLLSRWDRSARREESPNAHVSVSRIEVTDFDYDTMKKCSPPASAAAAGTSVFVHHFYRVLEYIYTDRTTLDWLCAVDVLRAADIYGLDRLKQMCEDLVVQVLQQNTMCLRGRRLTNVVGGVAGPGHGERKLSYGACRLPFSTPAGHGVCQLPLRLPCRQLQGDHIFPTVRNPRAELSSLSRANRARLSGLQSHLCKGLG